MLPAVGAWPLAASQGSVKPLACPAQPAFLLLLWLAGVLALSGLARACHPALKPAWLVAAKQKASKQRSGSSRPPLRKCNGCKAALLGHVA